VRNPTLSILNLDLQWGSGHAISASVDIQSFVCVTLCLAASKGNTAPISYKKKEEKYELAFTLRDLNLNEILRVMDGRTTYLENKSRILVPVEDEASLLEVGSGHRF
jgi:hypothetical protein